MKGFKDSNNKFHPITTYKAKPRKKREEPFDVKRDGVKIPQAKLIQMQRDVKVRDRKEQEMEMPHHEMPIDMSVTEQMEWENAVGSEIVKVKHEMMDGRPVTSVRFANGEEWFEFDSIDHQEEFIKENKIEVDDEVTGEFVEVDHPMISGYITMASGKVAFGEKEDTRKKRELTKNVLASPITFYEDPSHGYYEVSKEMLKDLGIEDKISGSSKREGDSVFLEEDRDATLFFDELRKQGIVLSQDLIKDKYFDDPNKNPASIDFGLCDNCGKFYRSAEELSKHKKIHRRS
ncbi:MAG: hypothetical protein KJI69_03770 [Patescibacteria group bacterium]|nr:hypothetical protein [Patescibacteria group bacterium]